MACARCQHTYVFSIHTKLPKIPNRMWRSWCWLCELLVWRLRDSATPGRQQSRWPIAGRKSATPNVTAVNPHCTASLWTSDDSLTSYNCKLTPSFATFWSQTVQSSATIIRHHKAPHELGWAQLTEATNLYIIVRCIRRSSRIANQLPECARLFRPALALMCILLHKHVQCGYKDRRKV